MTHQGSSRAGEGHPTRRSALIVAGAAGKGPYAAGVLTKLALDKRFEVRCLLGASSGALNAAVYAAGLRVGEELDAANLLCRLWRERAHWDQIITHAARVAVVREALEHYRQKKPDKGREVSLVVVVASLDGAPDEKYGYRRFEKTYKFETADFANEHALDTIAEVCVLSSTIPFAFPPREFDDQGQFWDGGIVNNTPIGHALKMDRSVDHMIVITPDSEHIERGHYHRLSTNRLLEMVIEERLARDLCEAKSFNKELEALCRAGIDLQKLGPEVQWKLLQFVEIRPERDLQGNLGSGFFSESRRKEYIEAGEQTAEDCLTKWKPEVFDTSPSRTRPEPRPETTT